MSPTTATEASSAGGTVDVAFDELHLDPEKTQGQLIFRLAENLMGIMIREDLKEYLEKEGFTDINFYNTTEAAL